jgi:hypothetical protein
MHDSGRYAVPNFSVAYAGLGVGYYNLPQPYELWIANYPRDFVPIASITTVTRKSSGILHLALASLRMETRAITRAGRSGATGRHH